MVPNAWKVHRWTRVFGQAFLRAFSKPLPPSVTTTSGGAIRFMSNQDDRFAAQVDPVNEHDLMHLIHHRINRPHLPQTLAPPPKRPAPAWHIRLPITAEQPGKKLTQVLGRGINPLHAS